MGIRVSAWQAKMRQQGQLVRTVGLGRASPCKVQWACVMLCEYKHCDHPSPQGDILSLSTICLNKFMVTLPCPAPSPSAAT